MQLHAFLLAKQGWGRPPLTSPPSTGARQALTKDLPQDPPKERKNSARFDLGGVVVLIESGWIRLDLRAADGASQERVGLHAGPAAICLGKVAPLLVTLLCQY